MRCTACDRINAGDARFCVGCGTPLDYAAWAPAATGATPASPRPATPAPAHAMPATPAMPVPVNGGVAYPAYEYQPTTQYGYQPAAFAAPSIQVVNNITVSSMAPSPVVVLDQADGPNLLIRALWFLFVGLWLGAICTVLAWLLNLTIIGLPIGLYIINRLPQIMTLKPAASRLRVTVQNGVTLVHRSPPPPRPFALRAVYFLLVGWWASLVWLVIAWALVAATLGLGLPLAFWMFDRTPRVTTLAY